MVRGQGAALTGSLAWYRELHQAAGALLRAARPYRETDERLKAAWDRLARCLGLAPAE